MQHLCDNKMGLLVDVHCHLDLLNDIQGAILRAKEAGVSSIITSGIDKETNRTALSLAKQFSIVKAALGIYPQDQLHKEYAGANKEYKTFDIDEEIKIIKENMNKIVAIGEIGLDYSQQPDKKAQRETFMKMIKLAEKLGKPVIVHSRKAEEEVVEILENSKLKKIVMHCFSGKASLVKRITDRGWYFSIPTNIVRSEHFQKIVRDVNLSRILTETDAPYLSPFRDRPNEPAYIIETVKKIAELKGLDSTEVANNIFFNYERVFL